MLLALARFGLLRGSAPTARPRARARHAVAGPLGGSNSGGTLVLPGLAALAESYDALLLDQFGVLHDGSTALPGAVDCFEKLAAAGKKLVVLSNTSRRRDFAMRKLPQLGFDERLLAGFVCSGEQTWDVMHASRRGQKVLWITWADDFPAWQSDYLAGLDLTLAPADSADFVLAHGSMVLRDGSASPAQTGMMHSGEMSVASEEALRTCAARGLPMLCANPDFYVTLPSGERGHMPGLVAQRYEELGGTVTYFGKPHAPAFDACLDLLEGTGVPRSRVLHVGDSLRHDVAGANAAGIDSLFVAEGIHAAELGIAEGGARSADDDEAGAPTADALERVFAVYDGVRPTHTVSSFVW